MWNKIQRIYVGDHYQTRPTWKPWANTLSYYPLKDDALDATCKTTFPGVLVKDGLGYRCTTYGRVSINEQINWFSFWMNIKSWATSWQPNISSDNRSMWFYNQHNNSSLTRSIFVFYNSSYANYVKKYSPNTGEWHHLWLGYTWSKSICSIDGTVYDLWTNGWANLNTWWHIGAQDVIRWDIIAENTCWTDQEIADYYNQTKATYQWFN